ncbi:MAG: universal stress protein [[Lactobacillus] timonensis]|uniref:universal stress protein n=1 Tax=[Lactobacillus] timonensis TaxID=1970790 RepID=UPI000C850414|nr:universal stress protein [[Lactobacillus] timonensis]MCI1926405.1 universal stress protein [[Lactobacillus] timonensis]MCI1957756.1 universal stress protein [[Lactobacillus] timonensis]MCI1970784.1 universal stress protein [[Lactobacillus] timonensis]MCI2006930.1 universal stress protein [[Lactobacillus] timonensis]
MTAYRKVLVGIDGSKQSTMALKKAIATAKRNQAQLYLLSIVNGPANDRQSSFGFLDQSAYQQTTETMEKLLAKKKEEAVAAGVPKVQTRVLSGNAKVELSTGFVAQEEIDLVVIGASGLNVVGRMIVGSTTAYVVREAPCDVMVVRTDEDNKPLAIEKASYPKM